MHLWGRGVGLSWGGGESGEDALPVKWTREDLNPGGWSLDFFWFFFLRWSLPAGRNPWLYDEKKGVPPLSRDWLFFRSSCLFFEVSGIVCRVTQCCLAKVQERTGARTLRVQTVGCATVCCQAADVFFHWFSHECVVGVFAWGRDTLDSL